MDEERALGVLALLHDDVRRRLYHHVRRSDRPLTREEAAKAVGISPKLAAFHLDKLVEGGLLDADFETPSGLRRRVGRAPKRYRPSPLQVELSLPPRRYDLLGQILVDTIGGAAMGDRPAVEVRQVAFEQGQKIGRSRREELRRGRLGTERTMAEACALLENLGFEPAQTDGELVLHNCPFHALAERAPDLVCGLNVAFIDGVLRGLGNTTVRADLAPTPGACCVRVRPAPVDNG